MKRTKFLALALVVAVMMMGAGYAYWSDTLTIENTVSTGKLDVDFNNLTWEKYTNYDSDTNFTTDDTNIMEAFVEIQSDDTDPSDGVDADNDGNTDKLDILITNLYPGGTVIAKCTLDNESTIPVLLEKIGCDLDGMDAGLVGYLTIDVTIAGKTYNLPAADTSGNVTALPTSLDNVRFADGDSKDIEVMIKLADNAPDTTTEEQGPVTFTLTPFFKQFNDPTQY